LEMIRFPFIAYPAIEKHGKIGAPEQLASQG
jgi:hypothetical protein